VEIREADAVIVGSQVTEGARVLDWVLATARGAVAFYDLDTILTLRLLERGVCDYLRPDLVPRLDAYLSTTGGPLLARIRDDLGAERVRPLYAGADPKEWPDRLPPQWDLGFLGAYCEAREPSLDRLLLQPARWSPDRRFVVAGGLYPRELRWPDNVELLGSIPPAQHRALFGAQRFLLDVTRPWVSRSGYSPSLALLDAAMCATSVITDHWIGIERFFVPGREILVAYSSTDVLEYLELSDAQREEIGMLARERVLAEHTSAHRARELERHALEWLSAKRTHAVQVPELRRAVA